MHSVIAGPDLETNKLDAVVYRPPHQRSLHFRENFVKKNVLE